MGTWGTAIKDSDTFTDIYDEFFELYNQGGEPVDISQKICANNAELLKVEEEKHNFWFALALAQWETKSLDPMVLSTVEKIITSGEDLNLWIELDSSEQDIKRRENVLDKFLEKLKSDRPKTKPRKKEKVKKPIFSTGDCLVFKTKNANYGGAIVLGTDTNPKTAYNLVATTRINMNSKPTLTDFEYAEVLVLNFAEWADKPHVDWYSPDLYYRNFSDTYELIGKLPVEVDYDSKNYDGKGYLFTPYYTSNWKMNCIFERQMDAELTKAKPSKTLTVKQLIQKKKWWDGFNRR